MAESVEQAALLAGIAASLDRIADADAATRALIEERDLLTREWIEQIETRVNSLTTLIAGRE